jgi:hypothetical protein
MGKMSELHAEMMEGINEPFPLLSDRKRAVMERLFDAQWEGDKEAEAAALHELILIEAKEKVGETQDPPF